MRDDDLLLAKVMIGFALMALLVDFAIILYSLWRQYA